MEKEHASLIKWSSCKEHLNLPRVKASQVKCLHVYDFDNTLFKSPAPNQNLLASDLIKELSNCQRFSNGGWWSEPRILSAAIEEWLTRKQAGEDVDNEFWNLDIVELTRLSIQDPETVSILLTGRREVFFADVIGKLLEHDVMAGELQFNAVFLKKEEFRTTLSYKTTCLTNLLNSYPNLKEISIYDDRPKQVKGFQIFLNEYVAAINNDLVYNLVHVPGEMRFLEPKREISIIADIIEEHNRDVDLLRRGSYRSRVSARPYFQMEKASVREVISYVGYTISIPSRKNIMEFVTQNLTHVFGSNDEERDQYTFCPAFIPAAKIHTLPSKVVLGQFVCGKRPSNDINEKTLVRYAEEFNELKRRVFVQFRLKRLGKYQNRVFYVDVEPIPLDRVVKTDAVKSLMFYLGQRIDSHIPMTRALYAISPESTEWEDIEQDVVIDTELQYNFKYHLSSFKKPQKRKYKSRII
ncbi:HGR067Cp [Eremothecium sinecaudum]|uniref:HGR067Cp n=1 Tax=Eremothecium sinecaudum TaxID=45286 RepID=A0A0X8HVC3_9SACH|nr:HGR067Cp [Eremothecium sinecaudum]AMD22406.1 HGR067Cp [Eremothecium sinecaudum]